MEIKRKKDVGNRIKGWEKLGIKPKTPAIKKRSK